MSQPTSAAADYDQSFFDRHRALSRASAEVIVPILVDLTRPESVIDVGCGTGTWLKVFQERGVTDVFGVDGGYVEQQWLEIPADRFRGVDMTCPPGLDRRFDLAMSLELAEHLPESGAESLIAMLTSCAPIIYFSAAIPKQGGRKHIHERWPDYWSTLFRGHDYHCIDCIRRNVWTDDRVAWWYAQNGLLFVHEKALATHPKLAALHEQWGGSPLPLVHPKNYMWKAKNFVFEDE